MLGSLIKILYPLVAGAKAAAATQPVLSSIRKYFFDEGGGRQTSDLYGMSKALGLKFDPNSSASADNLQMVAEQKAAGTKDQLSLMSLLNDLNSAMSTTNKERGYDGKY